MPLTPKDLDAIGRLLDARGYVTDESARGYRDEILTAVDAYKVLVKQYETEVAALRGKYNRLEVVLKRVAEKTGVATPEL
jgi:hypothetical protein